MTTKHIIPTLGRIVWYRGEDGESRAAIIVGVNSDYNVNLHVFAHNSNDMIFGCRNSVTHADAEQEPLCFPSWGWMPYQKQQAQSMNADVGGAVIHGSMMAPLGAAIKIDRDGAVVGIQHANGDLMESSDSDLHRLREVALNMALRTERARHQVEVLMAADAYLHFMQTGAIKSNAGKGGA